MHWTHGILSKGIRKEVCLQKTSNPKLPRLGKLIKQVDTGSSGVSTKLEGIVCFPDGSVVKKVKVKLLSCVRLSATPWIVAHQAPPSMGFSRQEYWSGLPFPSSGDLSNPGIEPRSPALWADALPSKPPGKLPNQETGVWSLGHEDPLEKEMATNSSFLAWEIPWTEEPAGLQSMGSQKNQTWLID